jgi:uncharacterized protein (UPF0335 family)
MAKKKTEEAPGVGHNSDAITGRLKSFVSRIERLNKDRDDVNEDIREVYGEAKSCGLSTKIIRTIVRERAMDADKRREENELLDLYRSAMGLLND